jgi:hypothetical protein
LPREATVFFREGAVDGWRRTLTPDQAARIVAARTVPSCGGWAIT